MKKVAILVDGGFYRKVSRFYCGEKSPEERARELRNYCFNHYKAKRGEEPHAELYRIFYYDCPPVEKIIYHPLLGKNIDLKKSKLFSWTNSFFNELKTMRKFALRLGVLADEMAYYAIKPEIVKDLCKKKITIDNLSEKDFELNIRQKGVDMKIGIDIASLAYKKQVEQIVLISGDSDFVPAAKLARREGIDFILDSMGQNIKSDLSEHIDGLKSYYMSLKNSVKKQIKS